MAVAHLLQVACKHAEGPEQGSQYVMAYGIYAMAWQGSAWAHIQDMACQLCRLEPWPLHSAESINKKGLHACRTGLAALCVRCAFAALDITDLCLDWCPGLGVAA
jgi:hypothetical protein